MLRNYLVVCFMAGIVCTSEAAGTTKSDKERDGLIGPVQMIIEESGTQTEGAVIWKQATTYDPTGSMTEFKVASGKVGGQVETGKTIYERDSKGRITGSKSFGGDGVLQEKTLYAYDKSGNQIEQAIYDKDGNLKFKFVHAYDADGNRVETKSYLRDGSLKSKSIYTYDSKRNMNSMSSFKDCTSDQRCKLAYRADNKYDERDHLAETVIYKAGGSLDERRAHIYNVGGHEQEMIVYNADGSIREKEIYPYEYDSVGNWIKKTTTKTVSKEGKLVPEPPHIVKRTITYYK